MYPREQKMLHQFHAVLCIHMHPNIYMHIMQKSRVVINYYVWQCYGVANAPYYYLLFMFCYLGLLQLIGLVLAIRTRKVKINILNDSKYVMAIIYVSSLVIVIMALVTFVPGTRLNLNEAFFSAGLLLSTSIFLSLTFIPKVLENIFALLDISILFHWLLTSYTVV